MAPATKPKRRSLSARLRLAFLALGLIAIGLTGFQSYQIAYRALEEASYERLTGIRETKKRQIENYFRDTTRVLAALASDESVVDAFLGFRTAWLQLESRPLTPEAVESIQEYYLLNVLPALRHPSGPAFGLLDLVPQSTAGKRLQLRPRNQAAVSERDDYEVVHRLYHPGMEHFVETFAFDDLLLVDAENLDVIYNTRQGPDLGIRLGQQSYAETNLAAAVTRGLHSESRTILVDFARYPGALGVPALFAAHAVRGPNDEKGVLAARLSVRKIDEVMTGGGSWREEGLGETGETYLVGPDLLMRSDSRFLLEDGQEHIAELRESGHDHDALSRLEAEGSSILNQRVDTAAAHAALDGQTSTRRVRDYRGIEVLSSFTPLDIPGLDWAMLSEIDTAEAFREIRSLRLQLAGLALVVSGAFAIVGYVIARDTTRPLLALTSEVERLGRQGRIDAKPTYDFQNADDEIARLWQTFEELTDRLRSTLVSRDHLDSLLGSMLNAVFVLAETDDGGRRTLVVKSANPSACRLLGYREEDIVGLQLSKIIGGSGDEPEWMDRLRRNRSLPAIETDLRTAAGGTMPVLFTAAFIEGAHGRTEEIVWVAQDIAERKAAEEQLRASRQESRVLAGRLLSAHEEERSRLARELHDDVTQRLAMLAIDVGKLARGNLLDADARSRLEELKERVVVLSHEIQDLSRRLHPSALDDLGLIAALRAECSGLSTRLGIPVSFASEEPPQSFPRDAALALYRIAQECFRNIATHADASEVSVELGVVEEAVRLTIEDNGKGFDRDAARERKGLGLASMDERVRLIGGSLRIRAKPGEGVKVTVEVPLEEVS